MFRQRLNHGVIDQLLYVLHYSLRERNLANAPLIILFVERVASVTELDFNKLSHIQFTKGYILICVKDILEQAVYFKSMLQ